MADKTEVIFADGMIVRKPRDNAPDFVKCNVSIKTDEFVKFLDTHTKPDGWVNIVIKESKGGAFYAQLDQWSKTPIAIERSSDEDIASAIPF